jgi:hypothetical protein
VDVPQIHPPGPSAAIDLLERVGTSGPVPLNLMRQVVAENEHVSNTAELSLDVRATPSEKAR